MTDILGLSSDDTPEEIDEKFRRCMEGNPCKRNCMRSEACLAVGGVKGFTTEPPMVRSVGSGWTSCPSEPIWQGGQETSSLWMCPISGVKVAACLVPVVLVSGCLLHQRLRGQLHRFGLQAAAPKPQTGAATPYRASVTVAMLAVISTMYNWWFCMALVDTHTAHPGPMVGHAGLIQLLACGCFLTPTTLGDLLFRMYARASRIYGDKHQSGYSALIEAVSESPLLLMAFFIVCIQPQVAPFLLMHADQKLAVSLVGPAMRLALARFTFINIWLVDIPQLISKALVLLLMPMPATDGPFLGKGHYPASAFPGAILSLVLIAIGTVRYVYALRIWRMYKDVLDVAGVGGKAAGVVRKLKTQQHGVRSTPQQVLFLSWLTAAAPSGSAGPGEEQTGNAIGTSDDGSSCESLSAISSASSRSDLSTSATSAISATSREGALPRRSNTNSSVSSSEASSNPTTASTDMSTPATTSSSGAGSASSGRNGAPASTVGKIRHGRDSEHGRRSRSASFTRQEAAETGTIHDLRRTASSTGAGKHRSSSVPNYTSTGSTNERSSRQ